MSKALAPLLGVAVAFLFAQPLARADLSKGVQKKLSGQILITAAPLPAGGESDAETLKQFRSLNLKSVAHQKGAEGVPVWNFSYTAFLKRAPKSSELSIDFFTTDKEKLYVASKRLMGVDPKLRVLSGSLSISEDDNLSKGRTYDVKITVQVGKKHVDLATTRLTTK